MGGNYKNKNTNFIVYNKKQLMQKSYLKSLLSNSKQQ